jgi:mRNA interferase HigB
MAERLAVRIISKRRLRTFWNSRKADSRIAERDLSTWYKLAKSAVWSNYATLKATFGSADCVGDCVVFDVGNNRFRLIGRVRYASGIVYVLKIMDHGEYDTRAWVAECGCFKAPPAKAAQATRPQARKTLPVRPKSRKRR